MARPTPSRYEVAAYYFPNFHRDARNDLWHGKGWTEWDLVTAARPRYAGHQQPIEPAWGCFDESDPAWAAREIDLAADHGITSFLFDWYWYEDGPYLQDALDHGFLKAASKDRLRFGIHWANHDWTNIHPANFENRPNVLAAGRVSRAAFERLTDHVIAAYFSQPNYLMIDDAPYFSIYELGTFIASMGGLAGAKDALDAFVAKAKLAGFAGVHLNCSVWGVSVLPAEVKLENRDEIVRRLGFNSTTTYAWVHHYDPNGAGRTFPRGSYADAAAHNFAAWNEYRHRFGVPYHPNVSMGWDPSPRTVQTDRYEARGYPFTAILEGNTPRAFEDALRRAKAFMDAGDDPFKMLTLNAWNEWTEGSYLLPDKVNGTKYLEAVKDVFGK